MIEHNQIVGVPLIGFSPSAYRAYLQMSHRKHVLVCDAREKTSVQLSLEDIAAETEQEIDIDIDNADFLLAHDESFITKDMVEQIYSDLQSTPCETKLVRFDELSQQFSTAHEMHNGEDNDLDSRIQRTFHELISNGVVLAEPAAIRHYLLSHQDLIELLPQVLRICSSQFEMQAQLSLGLYIDPEVVDSYLAIYVRQENYQQDVLNVIKSAREEYSELLGRTSGWIHLTTDFDSPH